MEIKSHMSTKPIPIEKKNERTFYCSRPQCKAELANEADLRRHETHFCKYKTTAKSVKNGENGFSTASNDNQKPKAVARLVFSPTDSVHSVPSTSGINNTRNRSLDSNNNQSSQTKRMTHENSHKSDARSDSNSNCVQTNGQNLTNDIRMKCEKYITRKYYDGIHYILCNAPNCKYTTKVEDKIYDHIQKMHSLVRQNSKPFDNIPLLRKRSQSSLDSNDTIVSKKSADSSHPKTSQKAIQKNSSQKIPQNSSQISSKKTPKMSQNLSQKSNDSDLKNAFRGYYKIKQIESEPHYFCEYPTDSTATVCRFYSKTEKELIDHFHQIHIVFKCDVSHCKKEFKSKNLLEVHKRNHICGFGIAGMKATGVCALENVRQYRREVLVNGVYRYECKICKFNSEVKSAVLSHAHNRHIHPPPPPH